MMNLIDMKTLVLNQILTYAVCMIVAGLLWQQNRQRFQGIGLWLVCFVMQTISIVLIALRGAIPDWLSIVLGGSAVPITATILLYVGLEEFVGRRTRQYHNILLLLVSGAIHTYFAFVQPSLAARNINFSIAAILLYAQIAWLMLGRVGPEMRPMTGKIGWIFIAFSVVSVGRIYFNLTEPAGNDLLKANNTFDTAMFLVYQVLFFAVAFGLFLMVNQRLFLELQTQQTALQKSETRYRQLVEFSPNALFVLHDGKFVLVNSAALSLMQATSPDQLLGKTVMDVVHPDYRSIVAERIEKVLTRGEQAPLLEEKFIRLDGTIIDVEVTTAPLEYQGQPALQSIVRDITARRKLEAALRHQNETLAALNQTMLELVDRHEVEDILETLLTKIGNLLHAQDVSIDLIEGEDTLITYAVTPDQPLTKGDTMRRGQGGWLSWQAVDSGQPAVLADYSTWERRRELYEGYPIHAIAILPINQRGRVIGTINFSRSEPNQPFNEADIQIGTQIAQTVALSLDNSQLYTQLRSELAERRQIEEVLRISQENYSSYFNMGTVGICVTAPDKSWIDVNDRLCEMLGYSKDELTHLTWSAMTHPDDLNADLELFEQLIRGERDSYQLDKRFIRKDGGVLHTSMYVSCQRYPNRSARYVLASLVDITERVQKEEALKQAQAEVLTQQRIMATYEERQRLGRNLHDSVNQSIHSLVLFADTLNSVLEKGNLKRSVEISEHLRESARQALKETRLLLYQIQPSNENNEVNLLRDLEKRLSTVEQRAGLQASVILEGTEEDCPEAWRENLFWIAIEALNNSLKHAQARSVMVYLRCFPEYVEMEISDDGIGFKSSRIRAGGMGLGNMHDRARQIGGTLSFISEPGKGTRVIVLAEIKKARSDQD